MENNLTYNTRRNLSPIRIGIDPAFRKQGFAICIMDLSDKTARFIVFKNGFLSFAQWLLNDRPETAYWCIENSNLDHRIWSKSAEAVGKNKAASQYTVDILKVLYRSEFVREVTPSEKGAKVGRVPFKLYSKDFTLIGYDHLECEQDKRDAFMLALMIT